MLRIFFAFLLILQPLAARSACEGTDLIAGLPGTERSALLAETAALPYAEGLLWRARRDDGTTITIFGTYHFRHDRTDRHLARLAPIIEAAQAIYLELSNEDQAQLKRDVATDPSLMFITEGPTLPDLLGEKDWNALRTAMQARNIPTFLAAKFKPIWAAMMLGIGPCEARSGAMEQPGIDEAIGAHAAAAGIPTRSLEDFRTLMSLFDGEPIDKQLDMIRLFFDWPVDADDMAYTLRRRYLAQQTGLLWTFTRRLSLQYGGPTAAEDFARFERDLLTRRNRNWLDRLLREAPGKPVFAAIGAGHLPGETGLLRLLERAGFEIAQLPF